MPTLTETGRIEACPKRVRVYLAGRLVADTIRAKLVWEVPHYPAYYIPRADVQRDMLTDSAREPSPSDRGEARYFDVRAGERVATAGAWHYPEPPIEALREHVRFAWDAMDTWLEEEDEVFVHPHDPHKRIDILHSSRHIEIVAGGVTLADTRRPTLLVETGAPVRWYLPKSDVRMDLLEPTNKKTGCAYKGFARYWRRLEGGREIAWSYPSPLAEGAKIAGLVAFYDEKVDVYVDGVLQKRPRTKFS